MRIIGHLPTEANASTFSDYLLVQGIHNSVEDEAGKWAIWIHAEDEIPKAKDLLDAFSANPRDARFQQSRVGCRGDQGKGGGGGREGGQATL